MVLKKKGCSGLSSKVADFEDGCQNFPLCPQIRPPVRTKSYNHLRHSPGKFLEYDAVNRKTEANAVSIGSQNIPAGFRHTPPVIIDKPEAKISKNNPIFAY